MDTVAELLGLLQQQTEINDELVRGRGNALVDQNIAKSPTGSTFGERKSPKLNSTEVRRTTEASSIFIKTFFEAERRYKPDKKEKTITSQLYKRADRARDRSQKIQAGQIPKSDSSWLDTLLAALGLGGLLKKLSPKFFKGLFSKILKGLGNMVQGLGKMISGFWKKITNSKFIQSISRFIRNALRGIGRTLSRIASGFQKFFSSIVKRLSGFWKSVKSSKAFKSIGSAFGRATKAMGAFFTGLKSKLLSLLNAAKEMAAKLIPAGAKEFIGEAATKAGAATRSVGRTVAEKAGSWWDIAKSLGGRALSAAKSTAIGVGESALELGSKGSKLAVKGVKAAGEFALGPAKTAVIDASKGVIKSSGGMFKLMGKLAKLPIIGPLIEGAFTTYDISSLKDKYNKGEISLEELQAQSGRRVVQGVSALGGSALGTFLGAAAGSIIPVGGNIVGGILGAIGGDMLGRFVGGLINDYIIPPKYSKSVGAFVTGTPPPQDEMQDFIIRGNQVYPFSSKDEVMGMKRGGAIDEFLSSKQENGGLNILVNAANAANMYLQGIERNTREMIKALGGRAGNVTVVNQNQGGGSSGGEKISVPVGNNRLGYSSSPYSLA